MEQAVWLNKIIAKSWPYVNQTVSQMLRTDVQPIVNDSMPSMFQPFKFEVVNLGRKPPVFNGIQIHEELVDDDTIIMDVDMSYDSDAVIEVSVNGIDAGVHDLHVSGLLRVFIRPLVGAVPIFGGMSMFFLEQPDVRFDLKGAANILDFPLVGSKLREVIDSELDKAMVLPNKIPVQMSPVVDKFDLQYSLPAGVVRLHFLEASFLMQTDINILGKADPDPYCQVKYEKTKQKTRVIDDTRKPVWNEYIEVIADQIHGESAKVVVLDEDIGDDDFLGRLSFPVLDLVKAGRWQQWVTLEGTSSGQLHYSAQWCSLQRNVDLLLPAIQEIEQERESSTTIHGQRSTALVSVIVKTVNNLPANEAKDRQLDVTLIVGGEKHQKKSINYNEGTCDVGLRCLKLMADPRGTEIHVEITNHSHRNTTKLLLNIDEVLASEGLDLNVTRDLTGKDAESSVLIGAKVRVLKAEEAVQVAADES